MKVLIIGATGLAGSASFEAFSNDSNHDVFGTRFLQKNEKLIPMDIRNKKEAGRVITDLAPEAIIHAAANPDVEFCEGHAGETRQINVAGSMNLIEFSKITGAKFVFFSSDYVFDGISGPYSEEDPVNPLNEYGMQKVEVEERIRKELDDYLIIRMTGLYGWEQRGKNFVMRLIESLKDGKTVKVPLDQVGSPTYAANMAQAVKALVEKDRAGTYHVCGRERIDRYSFARKVADAFGLEERLLIPVATSELHQKARRPLNAGMMVAKVEKELSFHLMNVSEGLDAMKQSEGQYKNGLQKAFKK